MKYNIYSKIIIIFVILFFFSNCTIAKNESFDYGKIENNVYSNTYLNFSIDLNPDWYLLSQEDGNRVQETVDEIAAGDKKLKAALKASEITVAKLLMLSEYEYGSPIVSRYYCLQQLFSLLY